MLIPKQKYYLLLLGVLLAPIIVSAAWSEPAQAPPGGNASVPVYSEGIGQTIVGTLHVDPSATNAIPLKANGSDTGILGTGTVNGLQGDSVANALFGNLTANGAGGGRAVYGLAVDAGDYGLYTAGGLGIGLASGDIWFSQQDAGVAWPRESDGASLYGVYVTNTGELQVRGHGAGINVMDQNLNSRLTVAEAGAVNVVTGPLTVSGTGVCLASGANCPPPPAQNPNYWDAVSGTNDIEVNKSGAVRIKHELLYDSFTGVNPVQNVIDFDPWNGNLGNYFLLRSGYNASYGEKWHLRVNRTGETLLGGNLFIGKGGGVASMTPYNDPTVNASWKIGLVGGANTIEINPGGGVGSVGDINLKSGTLKLKYINSDAGNVMLNDTLDVQYGIVNTMADNGGRVWINDELKVQNDLLANSKAAFGNYAIDPFFTVTTPSLWSDLGRFTKVVVGNPTGGFLTGSPPPPPQTGGFVNAEKLCIQGDCKASWSDVGIGPGGQNLLQVLQTAPNADASAFAGPTSIGGNVGIGLSGPTARLHVKATGNLEALRVVAGLWSPFIVRNSADGADLFRIDQSGNVGIGGVAVPLSNKLTVNGSVVFTGGGAFGFQVEGGNAIINGTMVAVDVIGNTSVTSPLLKIETPQGGNAETRIQSNLSPYWAIYQDDGTNELRFWNNNITNNKNALTFNATSGDVVVNNALGIGVVPSVKFEVADPNAIFAAIIDGNLGVSKNIVASQSITATQSITGSQSVCIGGNCKTGWGPNYSGNPPLVDVVIPGPPIPPAPPLLVTCSSGYVMVGIKVVSSTESRLVCARMW